MTEPVNQSKSNLNSTDMYTFEWPIFPKDETEKELRISEVAMREGADGFPNADATIFSMTENEIVGRIRRFYVSTLERISNEFVRLGEETAGIKIFLERFDIRQMPVQLKGKVESELTDAHVGMHSLASQMKVASDNLRNFKETHQITREPVYSVRWRQLVGPLLIVFLFGIEVVLNGALVSGVVDGLIAGISVATTVATMNVILSFIVGKQLLPELNKKGITTAKVGAIIGIIIHTLAILYLNLVFGIFRSIALGAQNIRSWEDAGTQESVINAIRPWETLSQINDIPSLFVVGVGIVFAIIALIDGYHYDDPYPGYGDAYRKFEKAAIPFEKEKKSLSDGILGVIEGSCSRMDTRIGEYELYMTRWATIQNIARQQLSRYIAWTDQIEQDANKFLNDYRAANIRGRHSNYSTQSTPAYFESKWSFNEEEKDPSRKFSHLTFLIDEDKEAFENKTLQIQQEMISVRDECVLKLQRFLQGLQEGLEKN